MSPDIIQLLRELRPADASATRALFPPDSRAELGEAIVQSGRSRPRPRPRARMRVRVRVHAHAHASGLRRRSFVPALGAAGIATVAVAALVLALTGSAVRPQAARAVVAFKAQADGDIVATVVDPFAAQQQLDAAFRAHGFDITVTLLPVSPSLVGTLLYMSGDGITPLQGGSCVTGGGGCDIGVRIAASFTGQGAIALGRPAQAGEAYDSTASVFAPGEPLHCSGLLGAQVSTAQAAFAARGLSVQWRMLTTQPGGTASTSQTLATPPPGDYVWDADAISAGQLIVWIQPAPWPADSQHGSAVNTGCSVAAASRADAAAGRG